MSTKLIYHRGTTGNYDDDCLWVRLLDPDRSDSSEDAWPQEVWAFAIVPYDSRADSGSTLEIDCRAWAAFTSHPDLFTDLGKLTSWSESNVIDVLRRCGATDYYEETNR